MSKITTTLKHCLLRPIAAASLATIIASCQYAKADSASDYSFDKVGTHIRLTCPYDGKTKVTSVYATDLNGDGKPELIIGTESCGTFIYRNDVLQKQVEQ